MAQGRMVIQITVICKCGSVQTYYGGGAHEENPGTVTGFLAAMMGHGWEEREGEVWECPECVYRRTGKGGDEAKKFAERFASC